MTVKKLPWLLAAAILLASVRQHSAQDNDSTSNPTLVTLDTGRITGSLAGEQKRIRVYKGIPYAAPPIGERRWKPPAPPALWSGVRACTEPGPTCVQPRPMIGVNPPRQSEDCLYLNVFTPARSANDRLPVMFWIHGGGLTTGAGSQAYYEGVGLADRGVVLVTINYRLGPFGFFAHPALSAESPDGISGNYGLLDQIAALKWVRRNTAAFGGDPGRVTIFGESAGSVSVCLLLVSPLAEGLFHRAIAQSGIPGGRIKHLKKKWRGRESMESVGLKIAADLGADAAQDPLAHLRGVDAETLLEATRPAQGLFGRGLKFGAVIDGRVVPDEPYRLFAAGKFHRVPIMTGANADEGTMFLKQLKIRRKLGYRLLVKSFAREHADDLLEQFPARTNRDIPAALNKMVTVMCFEAPARALARQVAENGGRVWLYHFTRDATTKRFRSYGAFHGAEIAYIFRHTRKPVTPGMKWVLAYDQVDHRLSDTMSACWARFAATGDPNGDDLPEWPPYDPAGDRLLVFGDEVTVTSGLHREGCDLIDRIRDSWTRKFEQE